MVLREIVLLKIIVVNAQILTHNFLKTMLEYRLNRYDEVRRCPNETWFLKYSGISCLRVLYVAAPSIIIYEFGSGCVSCLFYYMFRASLELSVRQNRSPALNKKYYDLVNIRRYGYNHFIVIDVGT